MASQITANIIKNGEPVDILYGRLSQEDDHAGDSNSIVNQRSYLEKYAADNGFQNPVFMAASSSTSSSPYLRKPPLSSCCIER